MIQFNVLAILTHRIKAPTQTPQLNIQYQMKASMYTFTWWRGSKNWNPRQYHVSTPRVSWGLW